MDIARPDIKKRKAKIRAIWISIGVVALIGISIGIANLKPAVPVLNRATLWTDQAVKGTMIRNVRGNGSLQPEKIVYLQSETDGRIDKINVLPGAIVTPETIIMELSNKTLEQSIFDLEQRIISSEARMDDLKVTLESSRLQKESLIATLQSSYTLASLEAEADEMLFQEQVIPDITRKQSRSKADNAKVMLDLEKKRLKIADDSERSQLKVAMADLDNLKASLALKRKQLGALKLSAGIHGVLQEIGDQQRLRVGQRIGPSSTLAKVVQPDKLKAEIEIAETMARDIQIGQRAEIDTRNALIEGEVERVDPAVKNGTVTVDIKLIGQLPKGARPDLSVDGTIELEKLEDVMYIKRPVNGQPFSTLAMYVIGEDGIGKMTNVEFGRTSVTTIEVISGLNEGDEVILSDMTQWEDFDSVKVK